MCCVELIKENIITVQKESVDNRKLIERDIDTYLDIIIDIQKDIHEINASISGLYELIHSCFIDLTKDDFLKIDALYRKLIKSLTLLYNAYKKSDFYLGIKTDLKVFKDRIDDLKEMGNDMKTFIFDLPQDRDYINLVNIINNL